MPFWKRSRTFEERFPPDRLAAMPLAVFGAADIASTEFGHSRGAVFNTKFFLGYLAGFPDYLDEMDQRLGGMIRKILFDQWWGSDVGQLRFARALVLISDGDQQAARGFGFGVPDGSRFFEALEKQQSAEGALTGVRTALQLGSIDFSQTVS